MDCASVSKRCGEKDAVENFQSIVTLCIITINYTITNYHLSILTTTESKPFEVFQQQVLKTAKKWRLVNGFLSVSKNKSHSGVLN